MNKKVIALVVAGALAAPLMAQAQQSNVTIYGRLNASLEEVSASDSVNGVHYYNHTRINTNISRIGFKGTEDLGNGLKAIWQVETSAAFDNAVGGGGGFLGDRPSFLGLTGNFGTVQLGRLEMPAKDLYSNFNDPWADLSGLGDISGIVGSSGGAVVTSTGAAVAGSNFGGNLRTRASNAIQYTTPNWGGFTGKVAYSSQNENVTINNQAKIWSASGMYQNGPLTITLVGERQNDLVGAAAGGGLAGGGLGAGVTGRSNTQYGTGFGYLFPSKTRLGLSYEKLSFDDTATTSRTRNGITASVEQTFGNNVLRAEYVRAGQYSGTSALTGSDTGAREYILGYGYNFSKRTQLYATAARINNDNSANYSFGVNALNGAGGVVSGTRQSGVALGILHFF